MKDQFTLFMSQLSETNATLASLTDFEKVSEKINAISIKLHQLNHLLCKENLEKAVREVYEENPKCFNVLGILVAVRENKIVLDKHNIPCHMSNYFLDCESICEFIYETGLADIFKSQQIKNLVDYVFGVEVGLDTNARKNRGGKVMELCVSRAFEDAGINFRREVSSSEFNNNLGLGEDLKRFDFVVETEGKCFLIEANYYNAGGSKLNEVARAYTDIAPKINKNHNIEFVWITDGQGWHQAKNKLAEAFNAIPHIYNLSTLPNFIEIIKS